MTAGVAVISSDNVDVMYTVDPLLKIVYVTTEGVGWAMQLAMLMYDVTVRSEMDSDGVSKAANAETVTVEGRGHVDA